MSKLPGEDLYQIKVTITGSEPHPIWRRLVVPKTITLEKLHQVVQTALGWSKSHPYSFSKGTLWYQELTEDLDEVTPNMKECKGVELKTLLVKEGEKINYMYGEGNGWQHKILLEKSSLPDDRVFPHIPLCMDGDQTCPTENSGGIYGYQKLQEIKDDENPDHKELCKQLREDMDRRACDLQAINKRLSKLV